MTQQGRGGMGIRKHGVSGHAGKSPRLRMWERLMAERQERKSKRRKLAHSSVIEAVRTGKKVALFLLLLPAAAHAQESDGFAIAPNGQFTTWGQGNIQSFGPDGSMFIAPQGGGYWCCGTQGVGQVDGPVQLAPIAPGGPQILVPAVPGE